MINHSQKLHFKLEFQVQLCNNHTRPASPHEPVYADRAGLVTNNKDIDLLAHASARCQTSSEAGTRSKKGSQHRRECFRHSWCPHCRTFAQPPAKTAALARPGSRFSAGLVGKHKKSPISLSVQPSHSCSAVSVTCLASAGPCRCSLCARFCYSARGSWLAEGNQSCAC